jgi:glycosyltransferase involved in cell wall biosynthesis
MRIAIDARFINPENRGLSTYTRNLVYGLESIDKKNEYFILLRDKDFALISFCNPNFKKVRAEAHWYGVREQLLVPKILYRLKPDLTHFPHFNVPLIYNRPFITTIHDLILFAFPTKKATTLGSVAYTIKNRAYRATINHAIYRSKGIIAVSENTSKDILRFFTSVDKNKISTIYEGAGGEDDNEINKYKNISLNNRRKWLQKKLSVKFPFIFYLGGAYPHKNLERLILGFKRAQEKNKNIFLIIAGGNDYFFDRLKKLVKSNKIPNVIFPGFISDRKTLEFLYQEALFCIFPSLYEGFGLPPLEALKRNKLVLCNNGTCFPEILGDSVVYFDGESVENITKTITSTIKKLESLKKTYLPRAQRTLTRYSWDKMAHETLKLYENTIEK